MESQPLTIATYFTDYIFNPENAKPEDQETCVRITYAVGILTLGIVPVAVVIAWGIGRLITWIKQELFGHEKKIQKVAEKTDIKPVTIQEEDNKPKPVDKSAIDKKEPEMAPSDLVRKTPVEELSLNKINPFRIDFKKDAKNRTAQEQADEILNYLEEFFTENEHGRIAITYSANSDQAKDIYAKYDSGDYVIGGANQAQLFAAILKGIRAKDWQDKFHVLPVPTCLHSGGAQVSTKKDVVDAMKNIAKHMTEGWIVLGLQNQDTKSDFPFAIGGGVAGNVWKNTEQEKICQKFMLSMLNGIIPSDDELNSVL